MQNQRAVLRRCSKTTPLAEVDPEAGYLGAPFVEGDDDDAAYAALVEDMSDLFDP